MFLIIFYFQKGEQAASLFLAQQYINEFGKLAKTNNTVIMPSDVSNINSIVTQVLGYFINMISQRTFYNM